MNKKRILILALVLVALIAVVAPVSATNYKGGYQGIVYINDTITYGDYPNASERLAICQVAGASGVRDEVLPKFIPNNSPASGINAEPLGWSFKPTGLTNGLNTSLSVGCWPYVRYPGWLDSDSGNVVFAWWQNVATDRPYSINFTAVPTIGPVPLVVNLTDDTTNATSYNWSVVDMSGSDIWVDWVTSKTVNPATVKLLGVGNYSVTDTITNGTGSHSLTKSAYIFAYPNATPTFYGDTNFTISMSPSTIQPNGTSTLTVTGGDFSLVLGFSLHANSTGFDTTYSEYPMYQKIGSNWMQYNGTSELYDINLGASFPSSLSLLNFDTPGANIMTAMFDPVNSSITIPLATTPFTVNGGNTKLARFTVVDGETLGFVPGATVCLRNPDGTWSNKTFSGTPVSYQVPLNQMITYTAKATGYTEAATRTMQVTQDFVSAISLSKSYNVTGTTTPLTVVTQKYIGSGFVNLPGVMVRVDPGGYVKYSPSSGLVVFDVPRNTTYSVTGSLTGYNSVTKSIYVGTTQTNLYLTLYSVTATPTPNPDDPTTSPTEDARSDAEKDAAMAKQVRDFAPNIIWIALIATFMGLLKIMRKW